jgi:hypothetical protein
MLSDLVTAIDGIIQDRAYDEPAIVKLINSAVKRIAGGVRVPVGSGYILSPPLPDLYTIGTVTTTTLSYASLPSNYQRRVFNVYDSSGITISPPQGGDYYSFALFLDQASNKALTDAGSVYRVCVKGSKIYYQGIPSAPATLGIHYYRQPVDRALDGDIPDGLPDHLAERLIKHKVCAEIFGNIIEDGQDNTGIGFKFHNARFLEAMADLIEFIGIDEGHSFYGEESSGFGSL